MSEYVYAAAQEVAYNTPALLNTRIPCNRGLVFHSDGSGLITLTGNSRIPCDRFVRYDVEYDANIAVPTGGTAGEIDLAIAIGGQAIPISIGASTPTVADAYNHVSGGMTIDVPRTVDYTASVINTSVTAEPINVRNLRVKINPTR